MRWFALVFLFSLSSWLHAQDTLPAFKVTAIGNDKAVIHWINNYPIVHQINIQRSSDSVKNFVTIHSVPDPMARQNGITDQKIPAGKIYYRLFILLENGQYVITPSQTPSKDTAGLAADYGITDAQNQRIHTESLTNTEKNELSQKLQSGQNNNRFFTVRKGQQYFKIADKDFKRFRDSLLFKTKDTIDYVSIDTIVIKPFSTLPVYKRSPFVYTEKDGNIVIDLPQAKARKYMVRFLQDDRRPLFTIDPVQDIYLMIDKAIFLQAGWYRFELYENGALKEENRFFIPKDF